MPRFFRPSRRKFRRGRPDGSRVAMRRLRKAHALFASGDYAEAAAIFERLAKGALARDLPQTAHLFLQAGVSQIFSGDSELGMNTIVHGFQILSEQRAKARMHQMRERILQRLKEHGYPQEEKVLRERLRDQFLAIGDSGQPSGSAADPVELPAKCPYCGGSVHPAEVEWVERDRAICAYCGSVLKAEG